MVTRPLSTAALLALAVQAGAATPARLVPEAELEPLRALPAEAAVARAAALELPDSWSHGTFVAVAEGRAGGGLRQTVVRQEVDGYPVFRGTHLAFHSPDGRLVGVKLGEVADPGRPGPFVLEEPDAVRLASEAVGGDEGAALATRIVLPDGPTAAWRVDLPESADPAQHWSVLVDATAGHVLATFDVTDSSAARARVYPRGILDGAVRVDFADDATVLSSASPAGWVAADFTEGNNAFAEDDRAGDGTTTAGRRAQAVGDPLDFDFPVTGVPLDDLDAALVNAFWAVNEAHDRFHELGFDEPSGACQNVNYGRGGLGNDRVRAYVQYRAGDTATGVRNSNTIFTGADGSSATINLGLWNTSGQLRDAAFDTGLVFHEYAHLVVVRLAGADSTCDDGTQPGALAEGWADYVAASWTGETVIGEWVSGNATNGLRTLPIDQNGYNYGNLCYILGDYCDRFQNGEIWAGALWDLREALIASHGPEEGARRADRLVVEGLRWTPCRPTFVAARDGLLAAEAALTGGADRCAVWSAMAARGLGVSAATTGPDDTLPLPGFDLPAECRAGASLAFERSRYGDEADARLVLADSTAGAPPRDLALASSSGDSETLAVPGGRGARAVSVALRPGAAIPGDGLLQVGEGDTIEARCAACPGSPLARATVSRALAVTVNVHRVTSDSCHADSVPDFPYPELPGLVDAGEVANVTVTLGNLETFPLDDVRVRVASDNPRLEVLPSTWIPVGRVRERTSAGRGFNVVLRVLASPSLSFGETAILTCEVQARGLAGTAQATLRLAADYTADRAVAAWGGPETFEPGSPSVAQWSHAPAYGRPSDQWDLRDCGDGGGRAMAYSGAGCTDYADTPSAATLVSPPLVDTMGGLVQAVHPVSLAWRNDVRLGVEPTFPNYCDSEMVLLYMSDNPGRPAYANPVGDRNNATQYWAQWPGLGDARNTSGYASALPRNAITATSFSGMNPANVRLYWAFMTDVYNSTNNGGCDRETSSVGGGYRLDDVEFRYDRVRVIPQADTSCASTCTVRAFLSVSPPGGSRCAGEPVLLDASLSEAAGCGSALEYRFTGPGTDTGYTPSPTATVVAAPNATWTVAVRCAASTGCNQSASVADPTLDDLTAGRVRPASLRVRHEGDDVVLSWESTRAPLAHAVFRGDAPARDPAARRAALVDMAVSPPPDTRRHALARAVVHVDAGAARNGVACSYYRVLSALPCAGTAEDR